MDLATQLREKGDSCALIFVTSSDAFAVASYEDVYKRQDCGNDFSNMLQASPLIVYKYMLNVNIRVDLSEKLCYPNYCSLVTFREK